MSTPRLVPCPVCRKQAPFSQENNYRPFCSHRCQLIDLGEWFNEEHRISDDQSEQMETGQNAADNFPSEH